MKKWWKLNLQKENGKFDTSRAANFLALWMLGAFFFYLTSVFIRSAIVYIITGNFTVGADVIQTLAYAAAVIVGSAALPILNYRFKDYLDKKDPKFKVSQEELGAAVVDEL